MQLILLSSLYFGAASGLFLPEVPTGYTLSPLPCLVWSIVEKREGREICFSPQAKDFAPGNEVTFFDPMIQMTFPPLLIGSDYTLRDPKTGDALEMGDDGLVRYVPYPRTQSFWRVKPGAHWTVKKFGGQFTLNSHLKATYWLNWETRLYYTTEKIFFTSRTTFPLVYSLKIAQVE